MKKTRYVIFGGFLGAGKTSAMIRFAKHLGENSLSAGLITNDQSVGLVDTARVRQAHFPVQEITRSCFCCNFNGLRDASKVLMDIEQPDVLIAEAVGSCTDLKATVSYPLHTLHGAEYEVAPLSVIVDPIRFGQALGVLDGGSFSEKVVYIYLKQLEEADIIVINKIDGLKDSLRNAISKAVKERFPQAKVFEVSCITGEGLKEWFTYIMEARMDTRPAMDVDYDIYADGEALLGWLNATVSIPILPFAYDGMGLLRQLAEGIRDRLEISVSEIAHLKISLVTRDQQKFGSVSLIRTNGEPVTTDSNDIDKVSQNADLIINLRAEADPAVIKKAVLEVLRSYGWISFAPEEINAFRPGRPTPTHRMTDCF